jgi:GABA(A) receptor-associated protein
MSNFKKSKTENERLTESSKIIERYPDRIPIIVEKDKKSKIKDIDKNKFLVPNDMTLGQFMYVIRKRIKLDSTEALFFFVNNVLCNNTQTLGEIYKTYKDKDGFLYILYNSENTFG